MALIFADFVGKGWVFPSCPAGRSAWIGASAGEMGWPRPGPACFAMAMRLPLLACLAVLPSLRAADPLYEIDLTVATRGFDGKSCWVHARAGAIPPQAPGNPSPLPLAVMTLQKLELSGSDVFHALNTMRSADLGQTWSAPVEHASFARQPFSWGGRNDLEITVCDYWPKWHAASGKLLGIGHTVVYENNAVAKVRPDRKSVV